MDSQPGAERELEDTEPIDVASVELVQDAAVEDGAAAPPLARARSRSPEAHHAPPLHARSDVSAAAALAPQRAQQGHQALPGVQVERVGSDAGMRRSTPERSRSGTPVRRPCDTPPTKHGSLMALALGATGGQASSGGGAALGAQLPGEDEPLSPRAGGNGPSSSMGDSAGGAAAHGAGGVGRVHPRSSTPLLGQYHPPGDSDVSSGSPAKRRRTTGGMSDDGGAGGGSPVQPQLTHNQQLMQQHLQKRAASSSGGGAAVLPPQQQHLGPQLIFHAASGGGLPHGMPTTLPGGRVLHISPAFEAVRAGPTTCLVECGGVNGVFDLQTERITCFCQDCETAVQEGYTSEFIPSEFERHGGMAACKKWRFSIKVTDTNPPLTLGRWLDMRGVTVTSYPTKTGRPGRGRPNIVTGASRHRMQVAAAHRRAREQFPSLQPHQHHHIVQPSHHHQPPPHHQQHANPAMRDILNGRAAQLLGGMGGMAAPPAPLAGMQQAGGSGATHATLAAELLKALTGSSGPAVGAGSSSAGGGANALLPALAAQLGGGNGSNAAVAAALQSLLGGRGGVGRGGRGGVGGGGNAPAAPPAPAAASPQQQLLALLQSQPVLAALLQQPLQASGGGDASRGRANDAGGRNLAAPALPLLHEPADAMHLGAFGSDAAASAAAAALAAAGDDSHGLGGGFGSGLGGGLGGLTGSLGQGTLSTTSLATSFSLPQATGSHLLSTDSQLLQELLGGGSTPLLVPHVSGPSLLGDGPSGPQGALPGLPGAQLLGGGLSGAMGSLPLPTVSSGSLSGMALLQQLLHRREGSGSGHSGGGGLGEPLGSGPLLLPSPDVTDSVLLPPLPRSPSAPAVDLASALEQARALMGRREPSGSAQPEQGRQLEDAGAKSALPASRRTLIESRLPAARAAASGSGGGTAADAAARVIAAAAAAANKPAARGGGDGASERDGGFGAAAAGAGGLGGGAGAPNERRSSGGGPKLYDALGDLGGRLGSLVADRKRKHKLESEYAVVVAERDELKEQLAHMRDENVGLRARCEAQDLELSAERQAREQLESQLVALLEELGELGE